MEIKNVMEDLATQKELVALGSKSTPTFKIGDKVIIGFKQHEIEKALDL